MEFIDNKEVLIVNKGWQYGHPIKIKSNEINFSINAIDRERINGNATEWLQLQATLQEVSKSKENESSV